MEEKDEEIHQPHDKLFKAGFSDPRDAAAFLQWRLPPEMVRAVNWEDLQLEPGSFIDSRFRASESDLLFSAPLLQGEDGEARRCYFYFLLEHYSRRPPFASLQILRYLVRIWEAWISRAGDEVKGAKLPPVIPLVVAQNGSSWNLPTRFPDSVNIPEGCEEWLRPFIPDFTFSLLELAEIPYEAIAGTPAGIIALRVLKAERCGELLGDAVWDEALLAQVARELFERVLRYLMGGGIDKDAFLRRLEKVNEPGIREVAMTLADQFVEVGIEQGIEQGIEKGREQGRESAARALVIEVLEVRFGEVPPEVREAVDVCTGQERLRALHRAAVLVPTLEQFRAEL